jgi:hypothetical protein
MSQSQQEILQTNRESADTVIQRFAQSMERLRSAVIQPQESNLNGADSFGIYQEALNNLHTRDKMLARIRNLAVTVAIEKSQDVVASLPPNCPKILSYYLDSWLLRVVDTDFGPSTEINTDRAGRTLIEKSNYMYERGQSQYILEYLDGGYLFVDPYRVVSGRRGIPGIMEDIRKDAKFYFKSSEEGIQTLPTVSEREIKIIEAFLNQFVYLVKDSFVRALPALVGELDFELQEPELVMRRDLFVVDDDVDTIDVMNLNQKAETVVHELSWESVAIIAAASSDFGKRVDDLRGDDEEFDETSVEGYYFVDLLGKKPSILGELTHDIEYFEGVSLSDILNALYEDAEWKEVLLEIDTLYDIKTEIERERETKYEDLERPEVEISRWQLNIEEFKDAESLSSIDFDNLDYNIERRYELYSKLRNPKVLVFQINGVYYDVEFSDRTECEISCWSESDFSDIIPVEKVLLHEAIEFFTLLLFGYERDSAMSKALYEKKQHDISDEELED